MAKSLRVNLIVNDDGQVVIKDFAKKTSQAFQETKTHADDLGKSILATATGFAAWETAKKIAGNLSDEIKSLTINVVNQGDRYNALSQQIGIAVEKLSGYSYLAKTSQSSIEALSVGIGWLSKHMLDAARGGEASQKIFKTLGLSATDSTGKLKSTDEMLKEIATKFSEMPDGAKKTGAAIELLGRTGRELVPALNEGGSAIEKYIKLGQELNGWTKEEAKLADKLSDNFVTLTSRMEGYKTKAGKELMPVMNAVVEVTDEWLAANKDLITMGLGKIPTLIQDYVIPSIFTLMKLMHESKTGLTEIWDIANIGWLNIQKLGNRTLGGKVKNQGDEDILNEMIKERKTALDKDILNEKDYQVKLAGLQDLIISKTIETQNKRKAVTIKTSDDIVVSDEKLTKKDEEELKQRAKNALDYFKMMQKNYDDMKKRIEKDIETTGKLYEQLYHDTGEYSDEYFEFESEKIELQRKQYKELTGDKNLADKWAANEYKKLEKEKTMASNNFFGGMKEGYNDLKAHQYTFAQAGYDTFKGMTDNMGSAFSSFGRGIKDGEGGFESMKNAASEFKEAMINMWIDMVAKMIAQWMMLQAATALGFGGSSFASGLGGGAMGGIGSAAGSGLGSLLGGGAAAGGVAGLSSALGGSAAASAGGATMIGETAYMANVPTTGAAAGAGVASTAAVLAPLAMAAVILYLHTSKTKAPGVTPPEALARLGYPDEYVMDWTKRYASSGAGLPGGVWSAGKARLDLWPTAQSMGAISTKSYDSTELNDELIRARRKSENQSLSDAELIKKLGFYQTGGISRPIYSRVLHDQGGYINSSTGLYADPTHRWISVTPGEAVLSPSTTARVGGETGVNRLNAGASSGTTIINNIYTNAIFSNEQDLLAYIDKGLHKLHRREYS